MNVFPDVSIGDTIDFRLYPSSIIGTTFSFCSIVAVLDYETAQKFIDADSLHANVYTTLPSTTPNDPSKYEYLKITLPSGQDTIIGKPWIIENSITKHSKSTVLFTVEEADNKDISAINTLLSANGYHAVKWTLE